MLCAVTKDFGHVFSETCPCIHTIALASISGGGKNPQFRFFSRPLFRHESHVQAAWLEN